VNIRPACNIAGGKNAGRAGFKIRIDSDTAIERQARTFSKLQPGPDADANDDKIGVYGYPAFQHRTLFLDRSHGIAKVKDNAVFFM
jgi:hypothetical protein